MRLPLALIAGAVMLAVGGCGGGGQPAPPRPVSSVTTTVTSVHVPPGFAGRLLEDNELTGFVISRVAVYTTPAAFVSSEQLNPADAQSETAMLTRSAFRVAAEENLDHSGVAGVSLVERFGSPAGARQALRFYVAKFRRVGGAGEYGAFPVAGVPGAVGFRLGNASGAGSNVAFAAGAYYYLLGEEGAGPGPQRSLGAAARSLYRRVRG